MSLRKRFERENATDSAESQEDDVSSERDEVSPLAATREIRRRERESKNKEMTEEEMMALALRLSEQEASVTARRLQEEEEAVKKAIQDSMFGESQGLLDAPPCISSRRKLVYANGESRTDTERSSTDSGEGGGQRAAGHVHRTRKRRHVEQGSPLKEMPDLSQTQPSLSSYETAPPGSQSPQSSDSTQIEDLNLPPSPIFPSGSAQAHVRVPRLDRELLDSCTKSGFVLLSQESTVTTQRSHCQQPARSPTFPNSSAQCSQKPGVAKSQMCDSGDKTQPEPSWEPRTSPVFGQTDCKSALQADTTEATALTFSSQESSTSFCLEKDVSLDKSPVFSKTQGRGLNRGEGSEHQSPVFGTSGWVLTTQEDGVEEHEDKRAEEEQSLSQTELTTDMTLHWSEEEDDDATPVVSPSPVFPDERSDLQTANKSEGSAESQAQSRAAAPPAGSAVGEVPCFSGDTAPQSTVHYYWGVPFCPRGLDPDQYTKVIVAQMEVYEKSLKQAQRGNLNKAKWGDPILPRPEKSPSPEPNSPMGILPKRRSWRLRGKLRELESEEEVEVMTQDRQRSPRTLWEEEEAHEEGDKERKQNEEEEGAGLEQQEEEGWQKKPMEEAVLEELREDGAQGESDCEVCPETQLSDDNTQELTLPSQPLLRSPEIETIQVDSPNVPEPQSPQTPEPAEPTVQGPESAEETMESNALELFKPGDTDLEGPHCESQSRESPQPSQPPHLDQDMDSQEPTEPDLGPGPDLVSHEESPVQCPLCQQVFPSDQIELHAAFCDGGPAAGDKASPKPRRKRLRRGEAENANHTHSEPGVAQEKCYICMKAVPLRDYSFHTDRCLLRPGLRTANTGGLLSALDQSEPRDSGAGPSGSSAQPQEVINLVDDDEEEDSLIQISNSPIRSFTAISDAQDCLIDFSRQHQDKRPGTRLGTKHRSKRR